MTRPPRTGHDSWLAVLALTDLALPWLSGGQPRAADLWIGGAAWAGLWWITRHRWSPPRARALLAALITWSLWGLDGLPWAPWWLAAGLLALAALLRPAATAWLALPLGVHVSALAWPALPPVLPWLVDLATLAALALRHRAVGPWVPVAGATLLTLPPPPGPQPDVLVITVDCLRADAWPPQAFDALGATHGVAVAPAPWTLGSLGSAFTGADPDLHGGSRDGSGFTAVDPDLPRLAEHFARAGYRTSAWSAGNVFTGAGYGLLQGFERVSHPWFAATHGLPRPRTAHGRSVPTAARWPGLVTTSPRHADELLASAVGDLRGSRFTWVHLMDLHLPYEAASCAPEILTAGRTREAMLADPWWSTPEGHACFRQAYTDVATTLLADLQQALDDLPDDTVVVITADHGESLGEDGLEHGHTLHPSVTVVPWWWIGPTSPEAGRSLQDLGATLADALGLPPFPGAPWTTSPAPARPVTNMLYGPPRRAVLRDGQLHPVEPPGAPIPIRDAPSEASLAEDQTAGAP